MRTKIIFIVAFVCLINCFHASSQWVRTTTPIPSMGTVRSLVTIGTNFFAGSSSWGIYFSPDNGATWTQRNGNFPTMEVFTMVTNGSDLFIGTGGVFGAGVYKSSDWGMTWVDITPLNMLRYGRLLGLTLDGTDIYACSDLPLDSTIGTGIFKSSITGIDSSSWTKFSTGSPAVPLNVGIRSLKIHGTNIYAGTYGRGVWVSSTSAPSWSATSGMASDGDYVPVISFSGNMGFAGNISGSPVLYRSADNGMNWTPSSTGVFENKPVYAIINDATTVYAGTELNGVMKSTDNGISWTTFNEGFKDTSGNWFCNDINVRSFVFKGNMIFAGTDCGVWKRQLAVTPVTPVTVSDSLVNIYPNPAGNTITLKVGRDDVGSTCIIKDANGAIVLQKRLTNETTSLEISRLVAGMYFVQVGRKRAIKLLKK